MMTDAQENTEAISLPDVTAIAVIDDAFIPVSVDRLPDDERTAVLSLLNNLNNQLALQDLDDRGFNQDAIVASPDSALDALTHPERDLGDAFATLADASGTLSVMIEERLTMRRIVAAMRATTSCAVLEVQPTEDIPDLNGHQLVFIDYYLERSKTDGTLAQRIAEDIERARKPDSAQQIILMSSLEKVRTFRKSFRQAARVEGTAFSFVAKPDLDEPWKVRAHLEMFARALPHSRSIARYIDAVKKNMNKARLQLAGLLDDLDLGDVAYLQNLALRADGHPLGDYLSWLLSSQLASLAFEYDLREEQALVDKIEFDEKLVSPTEPSMVVATLYHGALFARNMGPLGPHPLAKNTDGLLGVPLVQFGDVFVDDMRSKALVVLSADCDLAFAPSTQRMPDKSTSVLLVRGKPLAIRAVEQKGGANTTEGMEHDSEVYRIDWQFDTYRTVELGKFEAYMHDEGFDISSRDRLRSLYALKLQQEFGNHILRVGPPVIPPVQMAMSGEIVQSMGGERVVCSTLDAHGVFASFFKGKLSIRITPAIAGQLRSAVENLHGAMKDRLTSLATDQRKNGAVKKELSALVPKVKAIAGHLRIDKSWIELLGDESLPKVGSIRKLLPGLYLARGHEWTDPGGPAVVFQVTNPTN